MVRYLSIIVDMRDVNNELYEEGYNSCTDRNVSHRAMRSEN